MKIERFEQIKSWQKARELTNQVYSITGNKNFSKDYGLRSQIQRAAVSIMANIAEGFDGRSSKSFSTFLGYAYRSASEVQSHLYVALDQGYINRNKFDKLYGRTDKVKKLINGFIRYLNNKSTS